MKKLSSVQKNNKVQSDQLYVHIDTPILEQFVISLTVAIYIKHIIGDLFNPCRSLKTVITMHSSHYMYLVLTFILTFEVLSILGMYSHI